MQFAEYKAKSARRNLLGKIDVLGSFDFYTSLVSFDTLSEKDIEGMRDAFHDISIDELLGHRKLTPDQYIQAAKVLPLAAHEYTHFVDATSTLWGFRHLGLMNEAYLSGEVFGAPETQFSKAKLFYNHSRRIRLPAYYTVVPPGVENTRPWQSTISIGYLFSGDGAPTDKPILFSRFQNSKGDLLARSPVSIVSLLEASAMAQELLLEATLIKMTEQDFQLVEKAHFAERTMNYLYNQNITEYSVCAHIVANRQHCSDALEAFRLCAIIVRILLNMPQQIIEKIAESCPISDLLKSDNNSALTEAIHNGIRNGDLGVLFYLICTALPERSYESQDAAVNGVLEALKKMGVDFGSVRKEANSRALELCSGILASPISPISAIAKAGYDNFQKIDCLKPQLELPDLSFPPAILGDSTYSLVFGSEGNLLKDFDFEDCFNQLSAGQLWVERFAEACV